jgi:hypothetical protein
LVRLAAATTRSASSTVWAMGFSRKTCAPDSKAAIAYSAWVFGQVQTATTSGFSAARAP